MKAETDKRFKKSASPRFRHREDDGRNYGIGKSSDDYCYQN